MAKIDAKMTDQEMEQVVGGAKYYSTDVYRRNKITLVDGGATCYFQGHEISEDEAASIVFYKAQFPPSMVAEEMKEGWDSFLQTVTAYRGQQWSEFERHYMQNSGK